jgi:type IV/VI secretion system ImpK/VasF family protein
MVDEKHVAVALLLQQGAAGHGPLVELGFGILAWTALLRASVSPIDPDALRNQAEQELIRFTETCHARGLDKQQVSSACYCLCTLIDDTILNTPWGAHGPWQSRSLIESFYNGTAGGDRFFELLDQIRQAPERNLDLLELIAACLAMGCEGRLRVLPHGRAALKQLRDELECLLSGLNGSRGTLLNQPIQFYSCFISYSSRDEGFAQRLYADLLSKGVRCWFAPHDMRIGDRIRSRIDEVIQVHEKLLLVLSKHSIASEWVEKEVETAFEQERKGKRTVLFPVRLDNTILKCETGWPADIRRTRHIGDFRRWKEHYAYQEALERLLRDLKLEQNEQ